MPRIFVNYRTNDEENCAVLVERELSTIFGSANVFRASKSIPAGIPFDQSLLRGVWRSDALVAVIGKRWLAATDSRGNRALANADDWTRRELVEAFSHGVLVIPLLVNGTQPVKREDLPADLADLATRQYVRFDSRDPDTGLRKLTERLTELDGSVPQPPAPAEPAQPAGQRGGIGSVTGHNVNAVTDARGPVNITQSGFSSDGSMVVSGGTVRDARQRFRREGPS